MPTNRAQAKAELLRWHRWSVVLRAECYEHAGASTVHTLLNRALVGSREVPEYGTAAVSPWLDSPDYDPRAVEALVEGLTELYKSLAAAELADAKRLGDLFDTVEHLPLELMRVGPSRVEAYLNGTSERFHELVPLNLLFRHRLRN